MRCRQIGLYCVVLLLASFSAGALDLPDPHAGSDGAFEPTDDIQIDLEAAVTGPWETTPGAGNGVYDPAQWAVIFRYTSVTIPSSVSVTFRNNRACAPVIWLVEGDVTINGDISLFGASGDGGANGKYYTTPGPGGFRGGRGLISGAGPSDGLGPGGGASGTEYWIDAEGGKFFSVYGDSGCFPLIGGSGGGARGGYSYSDSGGAGGGAILIAAQGEIALNRTPAIRANGGDGSYYAGGGSGGMIRLVAETISGTGTLEAISYGNGEVGRIRLEANELLFTGQTNPTYHFAVVETTPQLLRDDTTPRLVLRTLGGEAIPEDPSNLLNYPAAVQLNEAGEALLVVDAENATPNMTVEARLVREDGTSAVTPMELVESDGSSSTWQALVDVAEGFTVMQVHAVYE